MNWKHIIVRLAAASAALCSPSQIAWGQSCPCEKGFAAAEGLFFNQPFPIVQTETWSHSTAIAEATVRDPFSGLMIPANRQVRWTDPASKTASRVSPKIARSDVGKSLSGKSSGGGAVGGGTGGFGGTGGGGGFGGGGMIGGGSTWAPQTGANGGGISGGSSTSMPGSAFLSRSIERSSIAGNGSNSNSNTVSSSDPAGSPSDPTDDLTQVDPPEGPLPVCTPEIPRVKDPENNSGDIVPSNDPIDSPVVPEPGSIILLAIAVSVGGADWLRRRTKSRHAAHG